MGKDMELIEAARIENFILDYWKRFWDTRKGQLTIIKSSSPNYIVFFILYSTSTKNIKPTNRRIRFNVFFRFHFEEIF